MNTIGLECLECRSLDAIALAEHRKSNALIKSSHASHLHSCKTLTAPAFSVIWLRTESHQTPVGIKLAAMFCDCPGG